MRRWLIFIASCLIYILSHFYRASVAVISPDLTADLALDARSLSIISASFFYAFALMQIPVGLYLDNLGPRISMTVLSLVAVFGAILFAKGAGMGTLTAGRALLGIGMACNLMGSLKLLTLWFRPGQFATLSAVIFSLGTAGSLLAATPLVVMVQAVGWRMSFVIMAAVTFFITLTFFLVVRDRPDASGIDRVKKGPVPSLAETLATARLLFGKRDFWIIALGTFCRYGIYAAVQALWAGPYLMQVIGLSPVAAGNVLLFMNVGLIIFSPVCGWLSDFIIISRKKVIVPGIAGMAVLLFVMAMLPGGTGPFAMMTLFFGFGLFSSSGQVMYAHIKEQVDIQHAGLAMTGINFFTMGGVAVFLQGMGSLMSWLYPQASLGAEAFKTTFILSGVCLTIMTGLYALTTETLRKPQPDE